MSGLLPRWLSGALLAAGILFFGGPAARAVAPPGRSKGPGYDLAVALQRECAARSGLRGVLIRPEGGATVNGQLRLDGLVERAEQRQDVTSAAAELLEANKAWKAALPRGVTAERLEVFPLNGKYLKLLQADFAQEGRSDRRRREVLRQTRLDEAWFDADGALIFRGACLASAAALTRADINALIVNAVKDAAQKGGALAPLRPVVLDRSVSARDVVLVPWPDRPVCLLQEMASRDDRLDGCLFWGQWYDADGTLQIEGLAAARHRKAIEGFLAQIESGHPECFRSAAQGKGRRWSLASLKDQGPPLTVGLLQSRLAAAVAPGALRDADPFLRRTRLDRRYFLYPAKEPGVLALNLDGVTLAEGYQREDSPARKRVRDFLVDECFKAWPELETTYAPVSVRIAMRHASQPRSELQRQIAARPALDGVGIDASSFFDERGRLCFRGVWRQRGSGGLLERWLGSTQEAELGRLTEEFLKAEKELFRAGKYPLTQSDFAFRLDEVRTDEVLRDLQQWVADTLEDSAVERLYFNETGRLTVTGFLADMSDNATPAEAKAKRDEAVAKLKEKLLGLIKAHRQLRGRTTVELLTPPFTLAVAAAAGEPPPPVVELETRPGLTGRLRAMIQWPLNPGAAHPDLKWDGVLLRRGSFAPGGKYSLVGLVDTARQKEELDALLRELSGRPEWRRPLARGWSLDGLKELPLEPMLSRLELVLPAHRVFDGLRVVGACHDVENSLLLRVRVIGPHPGRGGATVSDQLKAAAAELRRQLQAHGLWRARAEVGVRLYPLGQPARPDSRRAEAMVGTALLDLGAGQPGPGRIDCSTTGPARERLLDQVAVSLKGLDASLLNNPDDSTTWYLRALCYYIRRDLTRVERDLRRAAELEETEGPYGTARKLIRLGRLEHLQGDWRRQFAAIQARVMKQILTNRPPLTVAGEP